MLAEVEGRIAPRLTLATEDLGYSVRHSRGPGGNALKATRPISGLYTRR